LITMNELILGFNVGNWLLKKYRDSQLRTTLKEELSPYINNFDQAFSEFVESYYMVAGAGVVCRFFKPLININEKADEYIDNLKTSYSNFNKMLLALMNQINLHRDRVKKYLSDNDMMMIDIFIQSIKDDKIDLKKLYTSPLVMKTFYKSIAKRNAFEIKLNKGLQDFVKDENLNMMNPDKEAMKYLDKIIALGYTNPQKLNNILKKIAQEI
jgi:hypothetical protein